jgi:hypothetical protein
MSWPDEYFHSQLLTAAVTDPSVFAYAGALVAASAYEVANAGLTEALWLAEWMYARSASRLHREHQQALWQSADSGDDDWTTRRLEYLCGRDAHALSSLAGLVDEHEQLALEAKAATLKKSLAALKDQLLPATTSGKPARASAPAGSGISLSTAPRKRKRISTPGLAGMNYPDGLALCHTLQLQDAHFTDYVLKPATDEMWNRCDGKRTIAEIAAWAALQFNLRTSADSWLPVFAGWEKAGLISG